MNALFLLLCNVPHAYYYSWSRVFGFLHAPTWGEEDQAVAGVGRVVDWVVGRVVDSAVVVRGVVD